MELYNTPTPSQSQEAFINSEQITNQNNKQIKDINQFFIEEDNQQSNQIIKNDNTFTIIFLKYRFIVIPITIIILLGFTLPALLIDEKILEQYAKIFLILSGVIISFIILKSSNNKITIKKDLENNRVQIKLINFLCFPKLKIDCHIDNIIIFCENKESYDAETGSVSYYYSLSIYKQFQNLVDLDEDKVKRRPVNFYYSFSDISIGDCKTESEFNHKLNHFISSKNRKSNLKYYGDNNIEHCEHFFTHNIRNPNKGTCFDKIINLIAIFFNFFLFGGAIALFASKNDSIFTIMGIFIILAFNIFLYILYKCIKLLIENIIRIDCIYSKNFESIFIGLVKYTKNSYVNTFEYQINNVERFTLNKQGNHYSLKVELKNKEIQHIYTIKNRTKWELEKLAYFLNKQFMCNNKI